MKPKILLGISYYYPNISGLTLYAQRLAEGLAGDGYDVEVLTSRHLKTLQSREFKNNVVIRRAWTPFIFGRGPIMPCYFIDAFMAVWQADIVNCHIPQFEAFILVVIAKLLGKRVVLTHHCDLSNWPGWVNKIAESLTFFSLILSGTLADKIVVYTKDYADNSKYLSCFKGKLVYIFPPVKVENLDKGSKIESKFKSVKYKIGVAGRIAREKGIEFLLDGVPSFRNRFGANFKIILAGPSIEVIGGGNGKGLQKLFKKYRDNTALVGSLNQKDMAIFYSLIDVLVLPSTERLESFGLVQVEAMLFGCPVVASDLPGVRVPVQVTSMGKIVPPGNSKKLAEAIINVLENKKDFIKPRRYIEKIFNYQKVIGAYERLFESLLKLQ